MMNESDAMNSDCFGSLFRFAKQVEEEGLPADGEEEAFPKQRGGLVGCGDLSMQRKLAGGIGGGCKMKRFFCTHCEAESGDHDLLHYVTGDDICDRCVRNNRQTCAHRVVNDSDELDRKGEKIVELLLDDYRLTKGLPQASVLDMMPEGEVDCRVYENEPAV
jgi:hypothetical protein